VGARTPQSDDQPRYNRHRQLLSRLVDFAAQTGCAQPREEEEEAPHHLVVGVETSGEVDPGAAPFVGEAVRAERLAKVELGHSWHSMQSGLRRMPSLRLARWLVPPPRSGPGWVTAVSEGEMATRRHHHVRLRRHGPAWRPRLPLMQGRHPFDELHPYFGRT
jgi:hypothetical protein